MCRIDVEGSEFELVAGTDWSKAQIGQLLMEVHPGETMNASAPELARAFAPREFGSFLDDEARRRARHAFGMCDACLFTALQLNGFLLALERGGLREAPTLSSPNLGVIAAWSTIAIVS